MAKYRDISNTMEASLIVSKLTIITLSPIPDHVTSLYIILLDWDTVD
jgi:hypothetical protein